MIFVMLIVIWIGGIQVVFTVEVLLLHEHAIELDIAVVHD